VNWVEIIKLRSAGKTPEPLKAFLSAIGKNDRCGPKEVRVYRHAAWDSDWSLHLYWESEKPLEDGSVLGIQLSQALKEFGPVDHSVWIEEI
jgi:hypothetical protein